MILFFFRYSNEIDCVCAREIQNRLTARFYFLLCLRMMMMMLILLFLDCSVAQIKAMLCELGVKCEDAQLCYNGVTLRVESTLTACNITDRSCLFLINPLRDSYSQVIVKTLMEKTLYAHCLLCKELGCFCK